MSGDVGYESQIQTISAESREIWWLGWRLEHDKSQSFWPEWWKSSSSTERSTFCAQMIAERARVWVKVGKLWAILHKRNVDNWHYSFRFFLLSNIFKLIFICDLRDEWTESSWGLPVFMTNFALWIYFIFLIKFDGPYHHRLHFPSILIIQSC